MRRLAEGEPAGRLLKVWAGLECGLVCLNDNTDLLLGDIV